MLRVEGEGIALEPHHAVGVEDLELVVRALAEAGQEDFPHAGAGQATHRVHAAVPVVPVAHHRHAVRVRRPHGEGGALDAVFPVVRAGARAELLPEAVVIALGEEVQVQLAEDRAEAIRV